MKMKFTKGGLMLKNRTCRRVDFQKINTGSFLRTFEPDVNGRINLVEIGLAQILRQNYTVVASFVVYLWRCPYMTRYEHFATHKKTVSTMRYNIGRYRTVKQTRQDPTHSANKPNLLQRHRLSKLRLWRVAGTNIKTCTFFQRHTYSRTYVFLTNVLRGTDDSVRHFVPHWTIVQKRKRAAKRNKIILSKAAFSTFSQSHSSSTYTCWISWVK